MVLVPSELADTKPIQSLVQIVPVPNRVGSFAGDMADIIRNVGHERSPLSSWPAFAQIESAVA
jgi:hypothetical protein